MRRGEDEWKVTVASPQGRLVWYTDSDEWARVLAALA